MPILGPSGSAEQVGVGQDVMLWCKTCWCLPPWLLPEFCSRGKSHWWRQRGWLSQRDWGTLCREFCPLWQRPYTGLLEKTGPLRQQYPNQSKEGQSWKTLRNVILRLPFLFFVVSLHTSYTGDRKQPIQISLFDLLTDIQHVFVSRSNRVIYTQASIVLLCSDQFSHYARVQFNDS